MKKLLGSCLSVAVLVLALAASSKAAQPWATGGATSIFEVGASTPASTVVLISAGPGSFNSAILSTATAVGHFCVFIDSAGVSGVSTNPAAAGTNANPVVAQLTMITANTPESTKQPLPLRNGLVSVCTSVVRLLIMGSRN